MPDVTISEARRFSSTSPQSLVLWRNESDTILEMHPLLFLTPADSGLFGVPLHSLLEADHRVFPSTQVPLLLQAVSCPQLGFA